MNYNRPDKPDDDSARARGLVSVTQALPSVRDPYSPVGGYPDVNASWDLRQSLFEYLRILIKRRWIIVSVISASVVLGALTTLMKTPLYTSSVRMQIDRDVVKVVERGDVTPIEGTSSEFMKTQYELLQGRSMAERVVSTLKLGEDQDFFNPRQFSILRAIKTMIGGSPPVQNSQKINREGAAVGIVLGNRSVRPLMGSRLVDVSYTDPNPARAQRIANAYADTYVASNLDKRFQANSYAKVFLEDQIAQLKLRLEESEKALLDFGQQQQIVSTTEKASIAENNLSAANTALGNLVSERIKNEELWKQLDSAKAINLPQLLSNGVIDGLRSRRNALATDYQEKLETFKPSYPAMVEISNRIAEIDRQLAAELKTLKASYKAAYESSLAQETEMKKRIESLKADVLDLQKRSIQYNILKREVDTNRSLYDGLLQRYKQVDIAGGVGANNVFIVDKAMLPGGPSSPDMSRALMIFFVLGTGAGLALAYVLELLDDTLRSPEEIERISGLTTLGIIPKIGARESIEAELADPRSHASEAYRSLCTGLQLSTEGGLPRSLLVTSAGPGEGKSTTSLSIARHFANIGLKVLIIDADLRKPSLHTKLGLDNAIGLTNYLTGVSKPPELFQKTDTANLAFLASGPLPPNAADLLGSSRFLSLLSVGGEVFDLIIVDSPPVMGLADAPLLSSAVAASIFVVGAGQVRTRLIRAAIKRLQMSRAAVIGSVITRFDSMASYGYGYGYGDGYGAYGYGYGNDARALDQSKTMADGRKPQLAGARETG